MAKKNKYRFNVGDKVKIFALPSSSVGVKENDGKIVTIKKRCSFTWAYELEELDGLWQDDCFEHVRIVYATCDFNRATGQVCDTNGSLEWHDATLYDAMKQVERGLVGCALFFPADLPGYGHPLHADVTWEAFEAAPAIEGVCYYKGYSGYVFE